MVKIVGLWKRDNPAIDKRKNITKFLRLIRGISIRSMAIYVPHVSRQRKKFYSLYSPCGDWERRSTHVM